ncbi:hypothetical protein Barb7_00759 [Bacteroidales bacterium Barb7]|nr:hypothetical protein Barb7_00759 [Bacteroidales bacterium Barb7]
MEDEEEGEGDVFGCRELEAVFAYQFGKCQCRCELGKLGGLDAERPVHEPRMRAFDVGSQKDGGNQQYHDSGVKQVGEYIVEVAFQHHNDKNQDSRGGYPQQLRAGTSVRVEQSHAVKLVACPADTEPPAYHHEEVQDDGYPVHRPPQ